MAFWSCIRKIKNLRLSGKNGALRPRGPRACTWQLCRRECQNDFHPVSTNSSPSYPKPRRIFSLFDSTPDLPFHDISSPVSAPPPCDTSLSFSWSSPLLSETRYAADSQSNLNPAWQPVRPLRCGAWPGLIGPGEGGFFLQERGLGLLCSFFCFVFIIRP